jgi:hypothetical protein
LTKTIADEDWHVDEKNVATAIRFFPDVLSEKKDGLYPIIRAASLESNSYNTYNLKSVSRIPLLAELANNNNNCSPSSSNRKKRKNEVVVENDRPDSSSCKKMQTKK